MKYFKIQLLLTALVFAFVLSNFSETLAEDRKTVIDSVIVGKKVYKTGEYSNIVLSTSDSVIIKYSCKINGGERTPFLFRIKLSNSVDSSNHTDRRTTLKYKQMAEDNYSLVIEAFDPGKQWMASHARLDFAVNNARAAMHSELDSLRKHSAVQDSTVKSLNSELSGQSGTIHIPLLFLIAGIAGIAIFMIIILLFIIKKSKQTRNQNMNQAGNDTLDPVQLKAENEKLLSEIAALRGQIDNMQSRRSELMKQNKELQEKVAKLQSKKGELEDLQTQKDDLFAMIIHDIKNPAALIKSLVELLRSYDLTATEQQEVMEDIFATTNKIVFLSQEVSRILALEGSKLVLDMEPVSINEIVKDIAHTNSARARDKSIELLVELEENLPDAEVDPQKIEEVLDNLISNAIKFSNPKSKVMIKTQKDNGVIVVGVSDNGPGLSENDVKKAFKRGSKLTARPTAGEPSSGLGLWIVKKLIEAHKGKVWVRSKLEKGSTFYFLVPMKQDYDGTREIPNVLRGGR